MQISEHQVRERAYYIWEDEGRIHGRDALHWIRAESELGAAAPVEPAAAAVAATPAPVKKPAAKAKPAATKAKAPKAAVAVGLAAKAKPARAPAPLH